MIKQLIELFSNHWAKEIRKNEKRIDQMEATLNGEHDWFLHKADEKDKKFVCNCKEDI